MARTLITASLPNAKIVIDEAAIERWAADPTEEPMRITFKAASKVADFARDFVGKDSWDLHDSIRVEPSSNQYGKAGWLVRAGGYTWTRNSSGEDYAAYHHKDNPFLTDALDAAGVQGGRGFTEY